MTPPPTPQRSDWHLQEADALAQQHAVNPEQGLSADEAQRRAAQLHQ